MYAGAFSTERAIYEVRIKGHLDEGWSTWFEGLTITHQQDGTTLLTGPVSDQSALQGLLFRIANLGLTLLSVQRVETERGGES